MVLMLEGVVVGCEFRGVKVGGVGRNLEKYMGIEVSGKR